MIDGDLPAGLSNEKIDADAVCAQCGTVNPEGTLLCKTCGNNLRDQRFQRVVLAEGGEIPGAEPVRAGWVGKGVVLIGLLVLFWVAFNMTKIEDWLAGVQSTQTVDSGVLWTGEASGAFAELLDNLQANPVSAREIELAQTTPAADGVYEGRYVLMRNNLGHGRTVIGEAEARQDGDRLVFVALLARRSIEVRGEALFEGNTQIAARNSAGVRVNDRYYTASGLAQPMPAGGFECYALSDFSSDSYSILAFRIP